MARPNRRPIDEGFESSPPARRNRREVTDQFRQYFGELSDEDFDYLEFEEGAQQFHSRNQFEPRYSVGIRARF